MSLIHRLTTALLLAVALPAAVILSAQDTPLPEPPARPSHVVIISLDGARPDAIQQVDAVHIKALAERGAVDWHAQTVLPSVTLPAHTSMLTGLDVDEHGVTWNDSRPG